MTNSRHLILAAILLTGCLPPGAGGSGGGRTTGGSSGSAGMSSQCASASYGASAAARKVENFVHAAADFSTRTGELEARMRAACTSMGDELGVAAGGSMQETCNLVSTKLREEMAAVRGEGGISVELDAVPPRCSVEVDAYASCAADCDVNIEPGEVRVECEGGQIVGQCSAECTGECSVQVAGQCAGSCEGTCQGGCTGTCNGTCEGTCSSRGADGQCNGSCDGTCHGSCSAGCSGSCEGECWVSGQASCSGECRGGCSVEYERPRCTGTTRAPNVDVDCQASCETRMQAQASCEPGSAELRVSGGLSPEGQARMDRIRAAIRAGFGDFMLVAAEFRGLLDSGQRLVASARGLSGTGRAVLNAAACMAQSVVAIPAAMSRVEVSVSVQVEMSASVSAEAG